jgi:hypothetical protein
VVSVTDPSIRHNRQKYTSYKIAHHAQTEHSTQSYTNNKGHRNPEGQSTVRGQGVGGRIILRWATKNENGVSAGIVWLRAGSNWLSV